MDECESCDGQGAKWYCDSGYDESGYCIGYEVYEDCRSCDGTGIEGMKCECYYSDWGRNVNSEQCLIHGGK